MIIPDRDDSPSFKISMNSSRNYPRVYYNKVMNARRYRLILPFIFLALLCPKTGFSQQEEYILEEAPQAGSLRDTQNKLKERGILIRDLRLEKETMQDMMLELMAEKEKVEKELYEVLFDHSDSMIRELLNERLKKTRSSYEGEITMLKKIIASYKAEFQEMEKETNQLLDENELLEQQLLLSEDEKNNLKQEANSLSQDFAALQESSVREQQKLEGSITDQIDVVRIPLEAKIDVLKEQIQTSEHNNYQLQKEFDKDTARLNKRVQSYEAQLKDEKHALAEKISEVEHLAKKVDQYKEELNGSKVLLKDQGNQIKQLNTQVSLYKRELKSNEKAIAGLEGKNEILREQQQKKATWKLTNTTTAQKNKVMHTERQGNDRGAFLNLLSEEVENALDLLSY